jgi:spoIIIJ-associated protein
VEWVETTDKTVETATELALDQLGVLEAEAEVEVLEEPRQGMFGRVRGNARVRARVRPSAPPPKTDRKRKGRKDDKVGSTVGDRSKNSRESSGNGAKADSAASSSSSKGSSRASKNAGDKRSAGSGTPRSGASTRDGHSKRTDSGKPDREPMPEDEQRSAGEEFLVGLLAGFGFEASVSSSLDSDGILAFEMEGDQLGLLMGPGLNTLDSIQEVCRNCIQRQADGREYGKVVLDVSGVRADRTVALEDFVRNEAEQVTSSGEDVIFEVMSRTDRKIVHDVVSGIDGVSTESVGEDPRRRVILRPA